MLPARCLSPVHQSRWNATTGRYERLKYKKDFTMKRLLMLALAASLALPALAILPGCNTVEGAGKDISAGGHAIKDEAQEHKTY